MAINQIDKELNDRLMSYANTLARGDRALEQTLKQQAKNLGAVQQDVLEEYEEYLNKSRSWHGKEAEEAKARLMRLRKLERDAEKAQQEGIEAKISHNKLLKQIDAEQANLASGLTNLSKAEVAKRRAALAQQKNDAIQSFKESTKERTARYQLGQRAAGERRAFENKELTANAKWGNAFRSSLSSVGQMALNKAFSSLSVAQAVERLATIAFDAIKAGAKHGTGVSINPFNDNSAISTFGAARLGYDTKGWMEMINNPETQRAIRSSQRGLFEFTDGLKVAEKEFGNTIIDAKERSELARKNMELMSASGIRARSQDAVAFKNDMERIRLTTGESYEDFQKNIGSIAQDEDVRAQLKAATSEQERRAILEGISAQYAQNRAMGMTSEEATKAAKALSKLAGEKPLERFKKAAKLRAFGAAMGMGGEANRLADLEIKGKRRTAQENQEYQQIAGQMSERLTQTGTGSYEGEIFATQLADKLQLEQMLGPSSPFNNTLGAATKPLEEASKTLDRFPDALNKTMSEIHTMWSAVANNDILTTAGGVGLGIAGTKYGGSILSSLFGGGAAASKGAGALAQGASGASKFGSLAKGAGVAGAALDVGMGINDLANGKAQESMSGLDLISPMRWGMFVGDKINKGMEGILGDSLGSKIYDWTHGDENAAMTTPLATVAKKKEPPVDQPPTAEIKKKEPVAPVPPTVEQSKATEKEKAEAVKQDAAEATAVNSKEQVKKLDTSNDLLQQIAETTQRQVELSEKQLVALTLSETERADSQTRSNLRKDNRFGSQYGYA